MPELWKATFGPSQTTRYVASFFGGVLLLFGARLAGDCTSGHLISGISQLALSSFIFGIGWAIAGYCPGACVVGSARGKKDAIFTLLVALAGAFLFSLALPFLESTLIQPANFGAETLESILGSNGIYIALPFSIAMLFIAFFVLKDRYE